MHTKYQLSIFLLVFSFFVLKLDAQNTIGSWHGNIELPGAQLKMIFNITKNDNGKLSAKLDVPQQGATDIPVSTPELKTDSLYMNVPTIMGAFEGKFVTADSIAGKWSQAGQSFVLNLKNTGIVKAAKHPQTPQPPFSYLSKDVEYVNPKSDFKIAGTLTIPNNAENCPAVVLITGSGAQDRDETVFGHKPFWVIADYFANNGIAVLRVDDRGVGGSGGNIGDVTSALLATDVLCGVDYLLSEKGINKQKIGLIGHSEGGIIAPMVANQSKDVAFIIMMAGVGIPGDSLLIKQTELIARASGVPEQVINSQLFLTKGIINILKNETEAEKRSESLRNAVTGGMYKQMDADRQKMVDAQLQRYDNNWFSYLVSYDPRPNLSKLQCPLLALNGEKDLQVPPDPNLSAIEKALTEGGNTHVKTIKLPNLNHLFQNCETGLPQEYAQIEETISSEVLEIMKNWIFETTDKQ